ncbi:MAG: DUF1295 domain-containing protein, partial [Gemmatimonadales bacterium]|nr:DUF1295 domain-containing protein [Gemmatimonadales bacterium]
GGIGRVVRWVAGLVYLAAGLEVIIMITPFTVYFYSVYAPVLRRLESSPLTSWLTAFFLPHISSTGDPLLVALAYLAPILLGIGLAIFLVCAFQVYTAKLFRRGVVSGGLYRWARHPQYLGLAMAGVGLLLYWPRFIILLLYLAMLFIYYGLARHEESRMRRRFPDSYRTYQERTAMFLPGSPGGLVFAALRRRVPGHGWALVLLAFLVFAGGLATAAALRGYSRGRVALVADGGISMVSLTAAPTAEIRALLEMVRQDARVGSRLADLNGDPTLIAYAFPQDYMMQHLIADLGEHEAHHGKSDDSGFVTALKHLSQMYLLGPFRQLQVGLDGPKRVIFTEAVTPRGRPVPASRALDPGVLRFPLFFVDIEDRRVTMVMETRRRHSWGTIPVPAF